MTDTTEKLLPCAFCGNADIADIEMRMYDPTDSAYCQQVVCRRCNGSSGYFRTEAEARAAWNRRVAEKPKWTTEPKEPGIHVVKFNQHGDLGIAKVFQNRTVAIHNWKGLYRVPEDFSSHARWLRTDIPEILLEEEEQDDD